MRLKRFLGMGLPILAGTAAVLAAVGNYDELGNFLKNATDKELNTEREKVRLDSCNPGLDKSYRIKCHEKLKGYAANAAYPFFLFQKSFRSVSKLTSRYQRRNDLTRRNRLSIFRFLRSWKARGRRGL